MQPLISIVTPSYNQGRFIENTIQSVINQGYRRKEYLVIDGASADHSAEIIKKYEDRLAFWCSEKDNGQSDAINKGWQRAKGDVLAYLNSDDVLAANALEKVAHYFEKHPDAGIVYGDCRIIDENGNHIGIHRGKPLTFEKLLKNGQKGICQPAAFFNADVVRRLNYLDTKWHFSMDYDLILKIARVSAIHYIPEMLALYRIHSNTKSYSQVEKSWAENFEVRRGYTKDYPLKMKWNYLKFKLLTFAPGQVEKMIRKFRNIPRDKVMIKSFNDKLT